VSDLAPAHHDDQPAPLVTPILLLAMPQVLDPFFHHSVVLLVHHEDDGSFGFIVNRPTSIAITEILDGMEIDWEGGREALAYFGGPVQPQMGTVLFADLHGTEASTAEASTEHANELGEGLWMSQHLGDLASLAGAPPADFRLLLGYAGWGEGQLVSEILRNDWLTAPVSRELVFGAEPTQIWEQAMASVGVDPQTLPSWTRNDASEVTN
jgi:putative transcriptional regulator